VDGVVKLLLDTCVFIWLAYSPDRLSLAVRESVDDERNELWVSHASIWEISLKYFAGKLVLPEPPRLWVPRQLAVWGINDQSVDMESLFLSSELPQIHKDPFDRLIVAQTRTYQMSLVSPDENFPKYKIPVIW
jgi:PIN domain nuclease of toxin-antitoxin system